MRLRDLVKSLVVVVGLGFFAGLAGAQDGPESVWPGTKQFSMRVVATGLEAPWEITWGPDGMLWVTERMGKRIVRVDPASGEKRVAVTVEPVG